MSKQQWLCLRFRALFDFWATITSNGSPYAIGPSSCLSCLSVLCGVLWPNGWMDQDATWYGGRPRPRSHCVRWLPSSLPLGKGHSSASLFGLCLLWPNSWMNQDTTCYGGRPQPRRHCVRSGPSCPHGKGHNSPPPTFQPTLLCHSRPLQQLLSSCYNL